ncbi:hypothetical protein ACOMHN_067539 [Nucella lapillus]
MGMVTSHFRDNKTTVETLEEIEKDMNRLQKDRKEQQNLQRRVAGMLLWYSIALYMVAISFFYLFYWPQTWPRMVLCCLPLLSFPVMVWLLRKLLHWYFFRRITANELTVVELKDRKKQILEDVMENETYKKAKAILEKYDPAGFKKLEKAEVPAVMSSTPGAGGKITRYYRVPKRMSRRHLYCLNSNELGRYMCASVFVSVSLSVCVFAGVIPCTCLEGF